MGRFIGLSKNRGSGLAIEEPNFNNAGLIVTSNGTSLVLAGGASLNRTPLPDYINSSDSINITLTVTGAFGDSTYTFAWRNGAQFGLSLTSGGVLSGPGTSMAAVSTLTILITDTKYRVSYEADIIINVSATNSFPTITTSTSAGFGTVAGAYTRQYAASNSPTEWSITSAGNLPAGSTIDNSGVLSFGTGSLGGTGQNNTYTYSLGVRNASLPAGRFKITSFSHTVLFTEVQGQDTYRGEYGQAGGACSYNWVAPVGVTRVHVMAIGGGGGGCYQWAVCGGHGAGMVWANNIPVSPGSSYNIQVGRGGCWSGQQGGNSCWPNMVACGGCCGCYGGCFSFPGGPNGGAGTCCGGYGMMPYNNTAGGGGGGPGYCSAAPADYQTANYCGCGGGGGSATSHHSSTYGSGGGGGTGACGMCCFVTSNVSCGCCGNGGYSHQTGSGGQGGSGGTCGNPGEPWSNGQGNGYSCGGTYGGGGGGGGTSHGGGWGGPGVVRIIWGNSRCWPCCNTHNL